MNSLLHIAVFVGALSLAGKFYTTWNDSVIGLVVVIFVCWVGVLTILAAWNDVAALFGHRKDD